MSELVLHVGVHKTGSTSIQRTLNGKRRALLDHGIVVFDGSNHGKFYRAFTDSPESFHRYYRSWNKTPDQQKIRNDIKDFFNNNPGLVHIVSSEDISLLSEASLRSLCDFLDRDCGFSDISVVCFLREPLDYLNSSLQQYIKPGLTSLDEILQDSLLSYRLQGFPGFSGGSHNILADIYFPIPSKLIDAFGKENVSFIKFESARSTGLVSSIFEHVSSIAGYTPPDELYINRSLSHESSLLIAEYNNRNPLLISGNSLNKNRISNKTVSTLRRIEGRSPALINPNRINLDFVNSEVRRINSLVGRKIMTPMESFPGKYTENNLLTFSEYSFRSIVDLLGSDKLNLPTEDSQIETDMLTQINNAFEEKQRPRFLPSAISKIAQKFRTKYH